MQSARPGRTAGGSRGPRPRQRRRRPPRCCPRHRLARGCWMTPFKQCFAVSRGYLGSFWRRASDQKRVCHHHPSQHLSAARMARPLLLLSLMLLLCSTGELHLHRPPAVLYPSARPGGAPAQLEPRIVDLAGAALAVCAALQLRPAPCALAAYAAPAPWRFSQSLAAAAVTSAAALLLPGAAAQSTSAASSASRTSSLSRTRSTSPTTSGFTRSRTTTNAASSSRTVSVTHTRSRATSVTRPRSGR